MFLENITSFSLKDPSTAFSIIAIIISIISAIITFYYNKRIADANERMYKLSYEQDLLMRKEKHFNELKTRVIEPLLYKDRRSSFNSYFFIDMVRYHYPEVGNKIKQLATKYRVYENIRKDIISTCLAIIKEKGRKESIEFSIRNYMLEKNISFIIDILMNRETDYQKHVYINPPVEIPTNENNSELFRLEVLYELFLDSFAIYEHKDVNMVKKARETFLEALKEIQSNQKLRKLAEQYHKIGLEIPKLESEIRKELIRLLEQPPTALKLVNNELCPYMKGQEDKEFSEDEKITIEALLKNFPGEKRGLLID